VLKGNLVISRNKGTSLWNFVLNSELRKFRHGFCRTGQLATADTWFRTCRTSSFCTVAWQLARFRLTRRIARPSAIAELLVVTLHPIGEWSIVTSVLVFVCPRSCLRNYTSDRHQIFYACSYGRGSVVLWRRSDTLYVLPVLWMTSCLLISQGCSTSPPS